ncbi:hypothetical protein LguiA_030260 [Lonicera macranthoides]
MCVCVCEREERERERERENLLMKFGGDDRLIMEIIFTKFFENRTVLVRAGLYIYVYRYI